MRIKAEGKTNDGKPAYICELEYVGIFALKNIPPQHMSPILGIEAPSLLFPYARQVLMQSIQDGGFRPGLIQPINFAQLFVQQQQQQVKPAQA
jgi:preprotein translocase subunit SecB